MKKILITLIALSLSSNAFCQKTDSIPNVPMDPIILSHDKQEELLRDYPNPAWGKENWYLNRVIQLEDNLYTFANKNNNRTYFLITDEGVIVGDPIDTKSAELLYKSIRHITDKPIKYVIYSHNHWDHIEGGKIFKDEGAIFIAHEKCRDKIIERPNPEVVVPDIVFGGNYTVELGGERIDLLYYGRNHSESMVYPVLFGGKYMHIVDIVSPGAIPWGIVPDTDFEASVQSLEQLEKHPFQIIIPGHGVPIAAKSALTERRLYLTALMESVSKSLKNGYQYKKDEEQIIKDMEPWSYMRGWFAFNENITTMIYYIGIGE